MPGDRTQSQRQARSTASPPEPPADSPAFQEWYVVTGSGASALRISAGLTVGETEAGALALNDPEARHQWVEFVLSESGDPWVTVVTRDKSLRVDGEIHMRYQLTVGAAVELPGNTLYISHDIRMPRPAGVAIEVVPRDVPTGPRDLVGPGWEAALAAVQEPAPAIPPEAMAEALEPEEPAAPAARRSAESARVPDPDEDPDRTAVLAPREHARVGARAAEAPTEFADPLDDIGVTVAEPRPGRRYRRRPQRRRPASVLIGSIAVVTVALGGVAAVLYSLDTPDRPGVTDLDVPLRGDPAGTLPEPSATLPAEPAPASEPAVADSAGDPSLTVPGATSAQRPPPVQSPDAATAEPASERGIGLGGEVGARPQPGSPVESTDASANASAADSRIGSASGEVADPTGPGGDVALLPRADQGADGVADADDSARLAPVDEAAPIGADRPADEPADEPAGPPDWRLVRARELLETGYITYPPEDNAVAYLERLLAVDPGNPQALAMLDECSVRLINAAVRAHDQGMDYEARNTLEEVLGFNPENARANTLWREWVGTSR